MALETQVVRVQLDQGLDTKVDPDQAVPGTIVQLENAFWKKTGRIDKRPGHGSILSQAMTPSLLASFLDKQLLALDGATGALYSRAGSAVINAGTLDASKMRFASVPDQGSGAHEARSYASNGAQHAVLVYDANMAASPWAYEVFDAASGTASLFGYLSDPTYGTIVQAQLFALSTGFWILLANSAGQLWSLQITTALTLGTPAQVTTGLATTTPLLVGTVISDKVCFAFNKAGTPTTLYIGALSNAGAASTLAVGSETVYNDASNAGATVFADFAGTSFWVAYFNGARTAVKMARYSLALVVQTAAFQLKATATDTLFGICGAHGAATGYLYWTEKTSSVTLDNPAVGPTWSASFTTAGAGGASAQLFTRLALTGECAIVNGAPYIVAAYIGAAQVAARTAFIFRCSGTTSTLSGKFGAALCRSVASGLYQADANSLTVVFNQTVKQTNGGVSFSSMNLATLATRQKLQAVEYANALVVAAGVVQLCDGMQVVEQGWSCVPDTISAVENSTPGSLGAGQYSYTYLYEWFDANGNLHRSATCPPVTVVTTGKQVVVKGQLPGWGKGGSLGGIVASPNAYVGIYRTTLNGLIYYRVTTLQTSGNLGAPETFTFTDTAADTTIQSNEQLYTNGGEYDNIAAPPPAALFKKGTRLIVIPADNAYSWWFSKEAVPGYGPEFSDAFVQYIEQAGGPLVAGGQLDALTVLFKQNSGVLVVAGSGPAPNGDGNDFQPPQTVSPDSGCVDALSVLRVPEGLLFKSAKGIQLLDRSLNVQYAGARVEGYNDRSVVSASLLESIKQARFVLSDGTILLFDYLYNQWSVLPSTGAALGTVCRDVSGAGVNLFAIATSTGVLQETPTSFVDNGAPVLLKLQTGWISLAEFAGYQRLYKLLIFADWKSPHTLKITLAYDYDPANSQVYQYQALTAPVGIYQVVVKPKKQKCQSFQLTIEERQSYGGYGEGLSLSALAVEVGYKKGLMKLPASKSASTSTT